MKMKKRFLVLIAVCIFVLLSASAVAFADVDLSGMNYDELVALKDQINLAIWNSEEWQEVEVPQGVWEVGADIPVGKWEIKALPQGDIFVNYGDELAAGGTQVNFSTYSRIIGTENKYYDPGKDAASWIIELEEGYYVWVEGGTAIFMPYNGKPSLGFK